MKVPLTAYASGRGVTIVSRKDILKVPAPFEPYALVQKAGAKSSASSQMMKDFSSGETLRVYTYKIQDVAFEEISELRDKGWRVEHNRFIEQMFIDKPSFFKAYPNGQPDVLCFDIEVYTDGTGIFPHADRSPIISISVKYQDEPPVVFMDYGKGARPDKRIILDFLRYLKEKNPDIVVTYNGASFDLPYLYKRAVKCGIRMEKFSRMERDWHFKGSYSIPGQVHYDLYRVDVAKDQSLMGIKNRKMKTVARWFKIPVIELRADQLSDTRKLIGTDELRAYNASDVEITKALYDIYHLNHMMMAEILGIPFEHAVNAYPSFAPKIVLARALKKLGYVFLDTNEARYPTITGRYEGALVRIFKKGLIPKVWKLDVSGFYPAVMMAFNISPETTKIEAIEPFSGRWNHILKDGRFWFRIPDKKLQKDVVISIDQAPGGVLSTLLKEMKTERTKLKAKIKAGRSEEKKKASKAQSDALKVLMNAIYGSAALPETVYSDLGVALATISICRYIFGKIIERYKLDIIEADSVLGDTPIWMRQDGGPPNIMTIEDLYRFSAEKTCGTCRHFDENAQVKCTKACAGVESAAPYDKDAKCLWLDMLEWDSRDGRTMPKGLEVLSRSGWTEVEYVYRHVVQKPCYTVDTATGTISVTEDHSLFVKEKEVKPTGLKRGDILDSVSVEAGDGDDVISQAYARALGFVCATGVLVPVDDEYTSSHPHSEYAQALMFSVAVPIDIRAALLSSHPDTGYGEAMMHPGALVDRISRICFSGTTPKVPRAILGGGIEIAKAFLLGYCFGAKGLVTKHALTAAGLSHLVRKTGKIPAVSYKCDGGIGAIYTISQRAKDPGHRVTKVTQLAPGEERAVYDISTADGTFCTALGNILLHNTDGVYVDKPVDEKEVEEYVATVVKELIGHTDRRIEIEKDSYGPGWFHLAKNYILLDLDTGNPIFHGVAFKSSSHCAIYDRVLDKIARMVLANETKDAIWVAIQPMLDLSKYSLSDFLMRTTIRQDPTAYTNESAMQVRLADQAKVLGIDITPGTAIEYIVTRGRQYTLASKVRDTKEIDRGYYDREIQKVLSLFGLETINQLDLGL